MTPLKNLTQNLHIRVSSLAKCIAAVPLAIATTFLAIGYMWFVITNPTDGFNDDDL